MTRFTLCASLRGAITRMELLVVVVVSCLLMAMLIPAIQQSREVARGNTCRNNLSNVALSILNYENARSEFPGFINRFKVDDSPSGYLENAAGDEYPISWVIPLMPNLDRGDYFSQWRAINPAKLPAGNELSGLPSVRFPILNCPSNDRASGVSANSYVVNTGLSDRFYSEDLSARPLDLPSNGVFLDKFREPENTVSSRSISEGDGVTSTLMATENLDALDYRLTEEHQLGVVWHDALQAAGPAPPKELQRINATGTGDDPADTARPSSHHPGGVNVVHCDRHVQFLSEGIDYLVFCQLMASNDRTAQQPNGDPLIWDADGDGMADLNGTRNNATSEAEKQPEANGASTPVRH